MQLNLKSLMIAECSSTCLSTWPTWLGGPTISMWLKLLAIESWATVSSSLHICSISEVFHRLMLKNWDDWLCLSAGNIQGCYSILLYLLIAVSIQVILNYYFHISKNRWQVWEAYNNFFAMLLYTIDWWCHDVHELAGRKS